MKGLDKAEKELEKLVSRRDDIRRQLGTAEAEARNHRESMGRALINGVALESLTSELETVDRKRAVLAAAVTEIEAQVSAATEAVKELRRADIVQREAARMTEAGAVFGRIAAAVGDLGAASDDLLTYADEIGVLQNEMRRNNATGAAYTDPFGGDALKLRSAAGMIGDIVKRFEFAKLV